MADNTSPLAALNAADEAHKKRLEAYARQVDRLYSKAVAELSQLAARVGAIPQSSRFRFSQNPGIEEEVNRVIGSLVSEIRSVIEAGDREQWLAACAKSSRFISSILNTSRIPKDRLRQYQSRNLEALSAFQERKVNGLGLSERVWNHVSVLKDEVEAIVDTAQPYALNGINQPQNLQKVEEAIGKGISAGELSREIRSCLKEPSRLFRRVRDKYGNLHLSQNARLYHPGQGVYRSSYKNAMRMARTEINMAYRQSDHLRWQQLDFVVGMRISLSGNHTCLGADGKPHPYTDICDLLAGDYPKDFKFTGWHPQCRCIATPILKPYEEWNEERKLLNKAAYRSLPSSASVSVPPAAFRDYICANQKRIAGWKSTPYYIRDNAHYVANAVDPAGHPISRLALDDAEWKTLTGYRMYACMHQNSGKFGIALDAALKAQMSGDRKAFDEAMALMEFTKKTNERVREYTAMKKAKEDLYLVLKAHPDYEDVMYDPKTGGIKATHKGHTFDPEKGEYEKVSRDAGYASGHVVILTSEKFGQTGQRFTEGLWDGQKFEIMGCETATKNNYLRGLKHANSKPGATTAVLYFPKGGFSEEMIEEAILRYKGLVKADPDNFRHLERVVCVQDGKVVYDSPYEKVREAPVSWSTPRTAKIDDIAGLTKKLAAEINLDASKLGKLKTKTAKKTMDPAQERHKYDAQIDVLRQNAARYRLDMTAIDEAYTSLDMAKIETAIKEQQALMETGINRMEKIREAARKRHAADEAKLGGLSRREYAEKVLAERRERFAAIQEKSEEVSAMAKAYARDIDLARLKDLKARGQYNQMERENAAIEARIAEIKAADARFSDLIPDVSALHDRYCLEEISQAYSELENVFSVTKGMGLKAQEAYLSGMLGNVSNAIVSRGIGNRLAEVRIDIKIADLAPVISDIAAASQNSSVGSYRDMAAKAQAALSSRDVAQAESLLRQAQAMRPVVDQYEALLATGYKTSPKFNKAMADCLQSLNDGDVAQALKHVQDAAKIKADNDANVARRNARKARQAAAETEPAKKKVSKLPGQADNIDEVREIMGDDTPLLLEKYEDSIKRTEYTKSEYKKHHEEIEKELKELFDDSLFSHCTDEWLLDEAVLDNGILTTHQLHDRKGVGTLRDSDYDAGRRCYEHWAYGLSNDTGYGDGKSYYRSFLRPDREVAVKDRLGNGQYYRCGVPVPKDLTEAYTGYLSGYGKAQIILRKERIVTTFTYGNSLKTECIPSLTNDPKVCSVDMRKMTYGKKLTHEGIKDEAGYIEIQYLPKASEGRLMPKDMQSITLPKHPMEVIKRKDIWDRWKKEGVDIYYWDDKKKKVILYQKGDPIYDAIPARYSETAAQRKARQAKAQARAKARHAERDRTLQKQGLTAEAQTQRLIQQRAEEIAQMMSEAQTMVSNIGNLANADFSKSEFKHLETLVKAGNARRAKTEAARIKAVLQEQKKELEKLKDLIPDYERWHKDFTIEELKDAHTAIRKQIAWMETKYANRNDPNEVIAKWGRVAKDVEHPELRVPPAPRQKTWEVAKAAYIRRRDELIYQYRKDSIDENIARLKAFKAKTKDKAFKDTLKELEACAKEKRWGSVEELIEKAKTRMLEISGAPASEQVLKLGESARMLFSSEDFSQARKDAARWFRGKSDTSVQIKKAFKEADAYMSQYAEEMWNGLTLEEKHVLWLYSDGSQYINQEMLGTYCLHLRSWIDKSMRNGLSDANVLTSIIQKAPALRDDMWMQTGKSLEAFKAIFGTSLTPGKDLSKLIGREGTSELFTSCHAARNGAFTKNANTGTPNNVVLTIYMPKGTKGAYMEPFASWGDSKRGEEGMKWSGARRKEAPSDQVEFLLQRGARFRITKAEYRPSEGKWYIDVDLVEQRAVKALDTNIPGLDRRPERYKNPSS